MGKRLLTRVSISARGTITSLLRPFFVSAQIHPPRNLRWSDKDGKRSESFEGCEFGRQIIFDDGTALTCSTYRYHYAYRPKAVILMQVNAAGGGQPTGQGFPGLSARQPRLGKNILTD